MIRRYTVALMQMDTQNDKGKNLETACAWIDEAAAKGAKLICFPEVMNLIGKNIGEGGGREEIPGYTTERLCAKAKEHGVYIHGCLIMYHASQSTIQYRCRYPNTLQDGGIGYGVRPSGTGIHI